MTKLRNSLFMFAIATAISSAVAVPSYAQSSATSAASFEQKNQAFFKKKYKIQGSWSLTERNGTHYISFSDDFKTKNGPDLKIFLSPKSARNVSGKTAVSGSLNLGVLKSNKGAQEYEIPAGTDLSKYSTVLVHCQAYSVLWGGGSI